MKNFWCGLRTIKNYYFSIILTNTYVDAHTHVIFASRLSLLLRLILMV